MTRKRYRLSGLNIETEIEEAGNSNTPLEDEIQTATQGEQGEEGIPGPGAVLSSAEPADGTITNGNGIFYVDESSDTLKFKCKYADGTVMVADVADLAEPV